MSLRAGTLGLLACAALAAGAEEPGAPLEKSQRELKTLQRDQATRNSEAGAGKLGDGLPRIQAPVPGALPPNLPAPDRTEADLKKQKDARKNWLADGVKKLEKQQARAKNHDAPGDKGRAFGDGENRPRDSSDPDYVLKLYGEQQQEAEAKAEGKHRGAARTDPFAPFLQGWLGGSPVRGKFFDEFVRRPDAGGAPGGSAAAPLNGGNQDFTSIAPLGSVRETTVAALPNPYLQGLDLPSLPDVKTGRNLPATTAEAWSKPVDLPATAAAPALPPAARQADPKLALPPLADDKKYFPQLKKF